MMISFSDFIDKVFEEEPLLPFEAKVKECIETKGESLIDVENFLQMCSSYNPNQTLQSNSDLVVFSSVNPREKEISLDVFIDEISKKIYKGVRLQKYI